MELVNENMGALALCPVLGDTVEHGIRDDLQTGSFQRSIQLVDVKDCDPLGQIHIAFVTENVLRTAGEQLQIQGNILSKRFRLTQQFFTQDRQCGRSAGVLTLPVDCGNATVDDGLMLGADTLLVDAVQQGHDELGFGCKGVLLAVAGNHKHDIQAILAAYV